MRILIFLMLICQTEVVSAQNTYKLNDKSAMTISGSSTVHDWTVTANQMEGALEMNANAISKIGLTVPVDGIKSERGATMDKKMYAALKKDEYPSVHFQLQEIKGTTILTGMLNIAGTEKSVQIVAEINPTSDAISIKGEKKLVLQDFGMEPPTAMFGQIVVGDEVTVQFDLVFTKS
ncbi:MAG: YceI family protein [Flavobacteriaceae bacterium]